MTVEYLAVDGEPCGVLIDDAFPDIDRIREHAIGAKYVTMKGPEGATYTDVSFDIPQWLGDSVYARIREALGPVTPLSILFRMNHSRTRIPHWAHSDTKMCDALAILYLTPDAATPAGAGTAIVRHVDGLARHPETRDEFELWYKDHSNYDRWNILARAPMKYGRLVILPADRLHAALPPGGFGNDPTDARLILVTFFRRNHA